MISLLLISKRSNRGDICLLGLKYCAETQVNYSTNKRPGRETQKPASRSPIKGEFAGHFAPVLLRTLRSTKLGAFSRLRLWVQISPLQVPGGGACNPMRRAL